MVCHKQNAEEIEVKDQDKAKPNIIFIFADEWRAQATGYNGDPNCITPNLDRLAEESINVSRAVAGLPVCCPYRACLMTGQYPLTNGVFINDVELNPDCDSIARAFSDAGYATAYIGKWHLHGSPDGHYGRRKLPVPRSHQLGFDDWWGFECCHDYWNSPYYYNDDPQKHLWEGYDLFAQSDKAASYIREHQHDEKPYLLMLSWGPPHFPLHTAPDEYKALYQDREIELRPNIPAHRRDQAVEELSGYYAHIAALDEGLRRVLKAIEETGDQDNTLLIVTADHGEMAQSQGLDTKFVPFDESLRVPMLMRWPNGLGAQSREVAIPIDGPDIMPTLLGLIGEPTPVSVQGRDWSPWLQGDKPVTGEESAYLQCPASFTELCQYGIAPYRGIRTRDYTYVENHQGPWLLFDNEQDPYQMNNLAHAKKARTLRQQMKTRIKDWQEKLNDQFLPGETYLAQANLSHYKEVHFPVKEQWQYAWHVAD